MTSHFKLIILQIACLMYIIIRSCYAQQFYERLDTPSNFQNINSTEWLIDSLTSQDPNSRLYATKRLIEIKDSKALHALMRAFENSPYDSHVDIHDGCGITYYSLYAIGNIGGIEAEAYLWKVLHRILANAIGRNTTNDTSCAIFGSFDALGLAANKDSAAFFLEAAENESFQYYIRYMAYKTYARLYLKNNTFATAKDSLYYVLEDLRNIKVQSEYIREGVMSKEFVKQRAFQSLAAEFAESNPQILSEYASALTPSDSFYQQVIEMRDVVSKRIQLKDRRQRR